MSYDVSLDRFGNYTVTRAFDGASVYLCGDDAVIFEHEYEGAPLAFLDYVCSQYDDVMSVEG